MNRTLLGVLVVLLLVGASQPSWSPAAEDFDFSLFGDVALSVAQGRSTRETVTATVSSGTAGLVEFAADDLPPGATYLFSNPVCRPTCTSILTIRTTAATPPGRYQVNITAMGAGRTDSLR